MKKIWKSALLLPVILLLLLSACAKPEPPAAAPAPTPAPTPGETPVPIDTRYLRYDATEEARFDLSYEDHSFTGTELILLGQRKKENLLLRFPLAGGDAVEQTLDKAYKQVAAGPDCLWLGDRMELVRLDAAGQQTLSLTFPEMIEDLLCDETGRLYAAHRNSLTLVSPEGETESVPLPQGFTGGTLLRLGSGEIAVYASRVKGEAARLQRVSGSELLPVDIGNLSLGVFAAVEGSEDFFFVGWSFDQQLSEASQVYRFSGGQCTPVFDLAGAGREGKLRGLRKDGKDFLLLYEGEGETGLLRLSSSGVEKKILTVARLNNNHFVSDLISRYNREQTEYYLLNVGYGGDTEEARRRLEESLLSREKPDLLDTMLTDPQFYGTKGLLRDLYPMLDADPALSREDLAPSVLRALEAENGALYQMWPEFTVWTCAEPIAYVGEAESWTLEDMVRICGANPELVIGQGLRNLLNFTLTGVMERFADFETGELCFDSPEFAEYLSFIKEMTLRGNNYAGGDRLHFSSYFGTVGDFARGIADAEEQELVFTGYPCGGGTGHRCVGEISFAVVEGTGNEEAAWAFIRWFLSEEVQEDAEWLPMRRSVLEAQMEALKNGTPERTVTRFVDPVAAAAGENAETVTYTLPAVPGLSEEEYAVARRILDGIEGVYQDTVTDPRYWIICEECASFLRDERSAEDTAKAIQERLRDYHGHLGLEPYP